MKKLILSSFGLFLLLVPVAAQAALVATYQGFYDIFAA
jgi:hypothetical protein